MDQTYEEIKNAFYENCDECKLVNQKIAYIIEFKNDEDSKWFEDNIVFPKGKTDDSPVRNVMKFSKDADEFAKVMYKHAYTFNVKDKNDLIEKLKNR